MKTTVAECILNDLRSVNVELFVLVEFETKCFHKKCSHSKLLSAEIHRHPILCMPVFGL